ncbi:IclR family transcriptional regulator [Microbacterium testaceum]|uniref:IclR family transcriptional regulator n=1 Tax=Microbacterium testaceum TaxID=2033 RepID=UPI0017870823|nr:IclR family transcriptional regulator [Microbacterium testaceum]
MSNEDTANGEPRSQTRIQSVSRAVDLLIAVAESSTGETAKSLADRFELSLPTTYHLLTTLWAEGLISKDSQRVFQIGPRAEIIAQAVQRADAVPPAHRAALHQLVSETSETTYLGAWRGGTVKVLETAEGAHAVRVVGLNDAYAADDLHARASGKLLLAFSSPEVRAETLSRLKLRRLTPHTITRRADLIAELDRIREQGLSYDREEFQLGVSCISAPIRRNGDVVACLTVSSPMQRFPHVESAILAALDRAVATAEER